MEMLQIEDYAYDNVAHHWAALSRTTVVTGNMALPPWLFIIPACVSQWKQSLHHLVCFEDRP